ncbi:hypothetical protein MFLAVUS_002055 [Mucor flavus]|uniref:Uncharacterized protein n=1 Tax=Mucor flavus TaxID=439312 RepID=A0ABP9YP80_9FUNG
MPSNRNRLNNLPYIIAKKRTKLAAQESNTQEPATQGPAAQEPATGATIEGQILCKRYSQSGHKDARSRLCSRNKNYDPKKNGFRKKKREPEDNITTEGPPYKRNAASSSFSIGEGYTTSGIGSASASADTRSTTATIRSSIVANLSLERRLADQRARAAGKLVRVRQTKNPTAMKPCPDCKIYQEDWFEFIGIIAEARKIYILRLITETVEDYR